MLFPDLANARMTDSSGARWVADGLLTLPTHHYLTADDIARTADIMHAGVARVAHAKA